jgi:hypothetical protein
MAFRPEHSRASPVESGKRQGERTMIDREQRIREHAYSLWEAEGGIHGRHEDHWHQAEREIGETEPDAFSDKTAGPDTPPAASDDQSPPPARSGQNEAHQTPVEAGDDANPIHHEGRVPADPLSK